MGPLVTLSPTRPHRGVERKLPEDEREGVVNLSVCSSFFFFFFKCNFLASYCICSVTTDEGN